MASAYDILFQKLAKKSSIQRIPLNGTFELTSRCNFNCKMCYVHNSIEDSCTAENELTTDQWLGLASDARDAGMLSLILTGGEIFLRQDFKILYENIAKMGFKVTIYSNGSLIDRKIAKWLGKTPPASMEITLYGASAATYDKVCGNAKAYYDTINAIDYLLAEGINIQLKTTVTQFNKDDYKALLEFAEKRGLHLDIVDYLFPARSTIHTTGNCRLTPEELMDYYTMVFETNQEMLELHRDELNSEQVAEQNNNHFEDLSDEYTAKIKSAFSCDAGSSKFWITWDGRMLPCGVLEDIFELPLKIGFLNAWKALYDRCGEIPECVECRNCDANEFCDVCPAKRKAETGYFDRPAGYLCELAKLSKQEYSGQSA